MGKYIATALVTLCLKHITATPLYMGCFEPEPEPNLNALPASNYLKPRSLDMPSKCQHQFFADDKAPEITKHGDFIYFASDREGAGPVNLSSTIE